MVERPSPRGKLPVDVRLGIAAREKFARVQQRPIADGILHLTHRTMLAVVVAVLDVTVFAADHKYFSVLFHLRDSCSCCVLAFFSRN